MAGRNGIQQDWTDVQMLHALHLHENEGLAGAEVAQRLGRSRSGVLAMINRVNQATDKVDVLPHLNGTMPPRWWEKRRRRT